MDISSVVSRWGNSKGIRMPVEVLNQAQVELNDRLFFEVDDQKAKWLTVRREPPHDLRLSKKIICVYGADA